MPNITQPAAKPATDWATGAEPMTSRQRWFLKALCEKQGETFVETLTKAEASRKIDDLQSRVKTAAAKAS